MKIEKDAAEVTAGVRHGRTLGGPIALQVANRDYANWEERMNPWPVEAAVAEVHLPRPGHADLAGPAEVRLHRRAQRARARQRARDRRARGGRRAGQGVPARARRRGRLARDPDRPARARRSATAWRSRTSRRSTSRRCAAWTPTRREAMVEEINVLRKRNESLGGVFEVRAFGLVPGLGSHVSWEQRLDGRIGLAHAVDPGHEGRRASATASTSPGARGSQAHDEIFYDEERGYYRETNRSGGLEGGMTTGEPLVVRVRDEAAADADQAAALGRHRDRASRPRRCASAPTPAPCPPPAWWGRRWSRSCSPAPTARSSAATTSTTCARRSRAYEERIGWKRR